MSDFASVTFSGTVSKAPYYSANGKFPYIDITVTMLLAKRGGGQHEEVRSVVAYGAAATALNAAIREGARVLVTGTLLVREFTAQDGAVKTSLRVKAADVIRLDGAGVPQGVPAPASGVPAPAQQGAYVPPPAFPTPAQPVPPAPAPVQEIEPDDLPPF